ncbi:MAG TPA: SDR family oxidoreductase [Candidatus Binatia bacterium]|nr:SDR family oxidoreductase [Candidatus Binatia bacterium]
MLRGRTGSASGVAFPVVFPGNPAVMPLTTFEGHESTATDPSAATNLAARRAVVVMPRDPLQNGAAYDVSVTSGGVTTSWSFTVRCPRPAGAPGLAIRPPRVLSPAGMGELDGQIAFVTGAGSGLGREIALAFAGAGARVAVNDLRAEAARATHAALAALGRAACEPLVGDVADPSRVRSWFATLAGATGGRLDVLVNNAGHADADPETRTRLKRQVEELLGTGRVTTPLEATRRLSDERWTRMLAVHLNGTFFCTREALALMGPRGAGRIINMASIAGTTGIASVPHYSAAKAAIIGFTKAVARDVGPQGILVNAIAPGYVDTPILDVLGEERAAQTALVAAQTVVGRLGEPREVAATALFLAGPGATYFTGQVLSPNGGLVI